MREYDVLVVGQGVVGGIVSLYLAQRGHRVLSVEQHTRPYPLPRAVHYDPDVNRLLSGLGLDAAEQATFSEPAESYDWLNADRRLLLRFPAPIEGAQGWPESTMFSQPDLEAALRRQQERLDTLEVRWGTALVGIEQDAHSVVATLASAAAQEERIRIAYVVGCDGANSTTRRLVGVEQEDLGFTSDWLVMDLKTGPREWVPVNGQICDPARPTSCISGGPGRRRFEFMRMPGDDPASFATTETAWRLAEPWGIGPEDADLERLAEYTFHARVVTRWNVGRVFIAGDAAHLMPPFWGRGMVSGCRDALNLVWKMDHVLRGAARAELLDSYGTEREAHLRFALGMSVELGQMICETDVDKVAARDAHFLATGPLPWNAMPPMPPEVLGPGFFPGGEPGSDPVAGRVGEQHPLLGHDGNVALLDEISFGEFLILADMRRLTPEQAAALRAATPEPIVAKVIEIVPDDADRPNVHTGVDVTGGYGRLFDAHDRMLIVYRPDFHGFGSAVTFAEALTLVEALDPLAPGRRSEPEEELDEGSQG